MASTPWGVIISKLGLEPSSTWISMIAVVECAAAQFGS